MSFIIVKATIKPTPKMAIIEDINMNSCLNSMLLCLLNQKTYFINREIFVILLCNLIDSV